MDDDARTSEPERYVRADEAPTREVGNEGGSPGDVEIATSRAPAHGSEATETIRRRDVEQEEVRRDETGEGRRAP
jgi:hypothetical protein